MSDLKRVPGNMLSWQSIVIRCDTEEFYGFTECSYDDSLDRPPMRGARGIRGRPRGQYSVSASKIKGPMSSIMALRTYLASKSRDGKSYGTVFFNVILSYIEPDETPVLVELLQCFISKDASSHAEQAEGLMDEIEVQPRLIRRNGLTLAEEETV